MARGLLSVADTVKPSSAEAVRLLRDLGLNPVLLTGDNETVARAVAAEVGIDTVISGVLPEGKVDEVRRLQQSGRVVAMVGDGVNDAAALARADLGLAMGTGTDAAIEASDLTLVRGDLRVAADAIRLSRRTLRTIKGKSLFGIPQRLAQRVGGGVEFGRIWIGVGVAEVEVVDAPGGEHVHMQVRHLEPGNDEAGAGCVECGLLRGADAPRYRDEMGQQVIVRVGPLVDFNPRDDQRVSRPQRGDGEERDAAFVTPDESPRNLTLDNSAEQRRHDSPPGALRPKCSAAKSRHS